MYDWIIQNFENFRVNVILFCLVVARIGILIVLISCFISWVRHIVSTEEESEDNNNERFSR